MAEWVYIRIGRCTLRGHSPADEETTQINITHTAPGLKIVSPTISGMAADIRNQLRVGIRHICYEYAAFLSGAWQMLKYHPPPCNVLIQDATLTHLRALAEFFWFAKGATAGPPPRIDAKKPDLLAKYYSVKLAWDPAPFERSSNLMKALDKSLAHVSLARVLSDPTFGLAVAWDGPTHLHGAVSLILRTWADFSGSLNSRFRNDFDRWLIDYQDRFGIELHNFERVFTDAVTLRVSDGYRLHSLP